MTTYDDTWVSDWQVEQHLNYMGLPGEDEDLRIYILTVIDLARTDLWFVKVQMPEGYRHGDHGDRPPVYAIVNDVKLGRFIPASEADKVLMERRWEADRKWAAHRRLHGLHPDAWAENVPYIPLPCLGQTEQCPFTYVADATAHE